MIQSPENNVIVKVKTNHSEILQSTKVILAIEKSLNEKDE